MGKKWKRYTNARLFPGAWLPLTLFNILRDYNLLPTFVSQQPFLWALIVHSTAMTTVIWNPLLFFWLTGRPRRRRRRQGSVDDSILLSFLLAANPVSFLLRRRRRRRDCSSGTDDDYSTFDATYTEHEFSTTAAAYAATTMAVYKADNWFKKKISTNSNGSATNVICKNLTPTMPKRLDSIPSRIIIYENETSKILQCKISTSCRSSPGATVSTGRQAAPRVKAESLTDLNICKQECSPLGDGKRISTENLSAV